MHKRKRRRAARLSALPLVRLVVEVQPSRDAIEPQLYAIDLAILHSLGDVCLSSVALKHAETEAQTFQIFIDPIHAGANVTKVPVHDMGHFVRHTHNEKSHVAALKTH